MYPLKHNSDGAAMTRGSERIVQRYEGTSGTGGGRTGETDREAGRPTHTNKNTQTTRKKTGGGLKGGGWPHHRHTTRRGEEDTRQKTNDAHTSNPVGATNNGDVRKTGGVAVVQPTGRS